MDKHLGPGKVRVHAFRPGVPPKEIQLWCRGDNATDYGLHRWTDRSVTEVFGDYERRGNPLQIDVEHNNAEGPKSADDIGPTGGYARLEIRNQEPWLVFDWSAFAIEQIATRQRLFLSPEYDVDRETGEIIRLVRVSLVADPGTHNARMLASARRQRTGRTHSMDMKLFLAALKAALKAKDPGEAVGALISEVEGAVSGEEEEAPGSESPEALAKKAAAEQGEDKSKDPMKAAAEGEDKSKDPMKAADDKGAEGDKEKKDEPMAQRSAMKASAPSAEEKQLAARVAELEADRIKREAETRYQAAMPRIPESLRAYARKISVDEKDFADFIKGLPEVKGAGGVKASAGRTQTDAAVTRAGRMSEEDTVKMSRVFASNAPPETPFTLLPSGGIQASHMFRPHAGVNPQTLVPKHGIKEA